MADDVIGASVAFISTDKERPLGKVAKPLDLFKWISPFVPEVRDVRSLWSYHFVGEIMPPPQWTAYGL